jgi:hypothetical protein
LKNAIPSNPPREQGVLARRIHHSFALADAAGYFSTGRQVIRRTQLPFREAIGDLTGNPQQSNVAGSLIGKPFVLPSPIQAGVSRSGLSLRHS